ncbi:MAG TPA: ABC transporter ATP-binding protein [Xanthobacteraceae bacterium]|nr:ABC transporter ATP-binding protein [Xanthobacteraceae bacterium]
MFALQAKDLTVSVRIDSATVPAIRTLSFDLAPGKILGLVGESGAGKSMLGRAIAQLLPPGFSITGGSLSFEGKDLVPMPAAERRALLGRAIAFIPQAPMTALNPVQTIGAQFDEHLTRLDGASAADRHSRAIAMLEAARLPNAADLLRQYPHQLSGGMCQRVLIAMAFASNPRLVIADEPTTALDVTMHPPIIRLIADMQKSHGTAAIFITHDLRLAAQICDDVIVLYAGRAIESGPARAVLANPAHPYTRCLQLANPSMAERRALYVMPEQMPSLRQLAHMAGCHFAPRCPQVTAECSDAAPPDISPAEERSAACFHALTTPAIALGERTPDAASSSGRAVLEVQGLQKRYAAGGGLLSAPRTVTAVKDASFQIAENEFVALVGESGSGKSTIAKLLVGLERPTSGRILLNGEELTPETRQTMQSANAMQMVFQDPYSALNPRRRVASLVTQAMEAGSRHADWDERMARTRELLRDIGMPEDFATRLPGQLSGGQRQRVNIARALCAIPKILIADEIVSGLDVSIQAQLLNLLARLRDELDFAMLIISHDLSVVRHLCSRVLVMFRGEIVEQGPVETVFGNPQHPHTKALIASVPPDDPTAAWPMLQAAN